MNVVFSPEIEEYLFELTEILYKKEYFGFKKSAVQYVKNLISDIQNNLPSSVKHIAPVYFNKYGEIYFFPCLKKVKLHNGMCFSTYMKKKERLFT